MSADCVLNNWRVDVVSGSEYFPVSYGFLYNWYAATDARNICAEGWRVPLISDWLILCLYLDPDADYGEYGETNYYMDSNFAGGKLKELGEVYWNNPNVGATNEVGFNGKGSGWRGYDYGFFYDLKVINVLWAGDSTLGFSEVYFINSDTYFNATNYNDANYDTFKRYGLSIRPVKDSTTLTNGQTGTYTGNDGKVYRTICIGTQEWLADNLAETKYRNGDDIPEVTDDGAWAALDTGAMCAYNNDWNNV